MLLLLRLSAARARDSVKHVAPQRTGRRDERMVEIEICRGIAGHPNAFHHALRSEVRERGHRDDPFAIEYPEGEVERGAAAFDGIALLPVIEGQNASQPRSPA